jgi:WD40 repeat protein
MEGPSRYLTRLTASADGRTFAFTAYDGTVQLFDADTGAREASFTVGENLRVTAAAFRPDGAQLAVTDETGKLRWLDRHTGAILRTVQAHPTWINDVQYSADGARLVTAGRQDHQAKIWDAATGELLVTLAGHRDNVTRANFSPDGTMVASCGMDYTAIVWDASNGEIVRTIVGPTHTCTFNPGGTAELYTIGIRGYAAFWDLTLDPRGPEEMAAFVAKQSPWRLVDGRLQLR